MAPQKGPYTPLPALRLYAHPRGSHGIAQRRESVEKVPEREDGLIQVLGIARERHGLDGLSAPWGVRMGVRRLPLGLLGSSGPPAPPRASHSPAPFLAHEGQQGIVVPRPVSTPRRSSSVRTRNRSGRMQSLIRGLDGLAVEIWCARRG